MRWTIGFDFAAAGLLLAVTCCEPSTIDLMVGADAGGSGTCASEGSAWACGEVLDCSGSRPFYDPVSERCVRCLSSDDCDSDELCLDATSSCVQTCTEDRDCTRSDEVICDTARNACVECLEDADCHFGRCERGAGECVECLTDADCDAPEPYCEPGRYHCEECLSDEHCHDDQICDLEIEECIAR